MTLTWMGEVWHVGAERHDNLAKEEQTMHDDTAIWSRKGATLSDKSARQEFGLTQDEIYAAFRAGKLQFRESNMHGNPWFRLLRHEVEALVKEKSGKDHLHKKSSRRNFRI